jgi:hypothetical protein
MTFVTVSTGESYEAGEESNNSISRPSSTRAGVAITAIRNWSSRRRPEARGGERKPEDKKCDPVADDFCAPIRRADGPEHIIYFRQAVPIESLDVSIGDPVEGVPLLTFNCTPVETIAAELALDLRYEQSWYYRRALISALSAAIALAPGETLSVSVRNTQRKQFDRETIDEVERSEQTESTIADKDVLNVTRSSSKTNNWTISGNASISLPNGVGGAVNASVSETVNEASSSSAQRTSESTRKSASNLKTLQKVQIRESIEITTEAATARTITNPYRDRSLRLDVYELAKEYCVEFHLREVVPVTILTLDSLQFDRGFVLTNGAFLTDELIDQPLEFELTEALQVTTNLRLEGIEERAEGIALIALDYLFAGPTMFNFPVPFPAEDVPAEWNENDSMMSFQVPLEDWSGLRDAAANKLGIVFSTLAFYSQLYNAHVLPNDGRFAIEVAMSLEEVLAPRWTQVDESDAIKNVIDARQATEIFRRLGGFLTMTSGILRPLLQPAEEEREARRAAERAEFVITRVVDHLNCHKRYYTERYVSYMAARTDMQAVYRLAEEVLGERMDGAGTDLLDIFATDAAFLDGRRVIVPIRTSLGAGELAALFKQFDEQVVDVEPRLLDVQTLTVPTDGVHIESMAGTCVLEAVPDPPIAGPIHVAMDKQ